MKQSFDNVKTFPLPDTHLSGAAVLACSIIDHRENVSECRRERESLQVAIKELWRLAHVFEDMLTRYDTALRLDVAAREHPIFKVPGWFFEAESDDGKAMLTRRARYLRGARIDIDQAWDLCREFATDILHDIDPDGAVRQAIMAAYGAGKGGADACS